MGNLDDMIAVATRHVGECRPIVERQRKLIAEGWTGPGAAQLLLCFEQSLKIFEAELDRLLEERGPK